MHMYIPYRQSMCYLAGNKLIKMSII